MLAGARGRTKQKREGGKTHRRRATRVPRGRWLVVEDEFFSVVVRRVKRDKKCTGYEQDGKQMDPNSAVVGDCSPYAVAAQEEEVYALCIVLG
jgi:hypothetical protein